MTTFSEGSSSLDLPLTECLRFIGAVRPEFESIITHQEVLERVADLGFQVSYSYHRFYENHSHNDSLYRAIQQSCSDLNFLQQQVIQLYVSGEELSGSGVTDDDDDPRLPPQELDIPRIYAVATKIASSIDLDIPTYLDESDQIIFVLSMIERYSETVKTIPAIYALLSGIVRGKREHTDILWTISRFLRFYISNKPAYDWLRRALRGHNGSDGLYQHTYVDQVRRDAFPKDDDALFDKQIKKLLDMKVKWVALAEDDTGTVPLVSIKGKMLENIIISHQDTQTRISLAPLLDASNTMKYAALADLLTTNAIVTKLRVVIAIPIEGTGPTVPLGVFPVSGSLNTLALRERYLERLNAVGINVFGCCGDGDQAQLRASLLSTTIDPAKAINVGFGLEDGEHAERDSETVSVGVAEADVGETEDDEQLRCTAKTMIRLYPTKAFFCGSDVDHVAMNVYYVASNDKDNTIGYLHANTAKAYKKLVVSHPELNLRLSDFLYRRQNYDGGANLARVCGAVMRMAAGGDGQVADNDLAALGFLGSIMDLLFDCFFGSANAITVEGRIAALWTAVCCLRAWNKCESPGKPSYAVLNGVELLGTSFIHALLYLKSIGVTEVNIARLFEEQHCETFFASLRTCGHDGQGSTFTYSQGRGRLSAVLDVQDAKAEMEGHGLPVYHASAVTKVGDHVEHGCVVSIAALTPEGVLRAVESALPPALALCAKIGIERGEVIYCVKNSPMPNPKQMSLATTQAVTDESEGAEELSVEQMEDEFEHAQDISVLQTAALASEGPDEPADGATAVVDGRDGGNLHGRVYVDVNGRKMPFARAVAVFVSGRDRKSRNSSVAARTAAPNVQGGPSEPADGAGARTRKRRRARELSSSSSSSAASGALDGDRDEDIVGAADDGDDSTRDGRGDGVSATYTETWEEYKAKTSKPEDNPEHFIIGGLAALHEPRDKRQARRTRGGWKNRRLGRDEVDPCRISMGK